MWLKTLRTDSKFGDFWLKKIRFSKLFVQEKENNDQKTLLDKFVHP